MGLGAALLLLIPAAPAHAQDPGSGVAIGATYLTDTIANVSGGVSRGAAWLGRADIRAEFDEDALGIDGASAALDIIWTHGSAFSAEKAGDMQVVSNVEGDRVLRPYEAWLQLPLGQGGLAVKAGLIDSNSEFDVQTIGMLFLNSSHGTGPDFSKSGVDGPSIFPVTASTVMLKLEKPHWSIRLGLLNAVAGDPERPRNFRLRFPGEDGSLLIAEGDIRLTEAVELQLGGWTYTRRLDTIDPARAAQRGSHGGYAQIEAKIAGHDMGGRLDGWIRGGMASGAVNRVTRYIGGGLTYGRGDGRWGIAVAHARQSRLAERIFEDAPRRAETNIEFTYARQVAPFLTVQPDVQYVIDPGWSATTRNALVVGVRFSFEMWKR
jgi:porin